jgi:polysaccharide export outer membrane protein
MRGSQAFVQLTVRWGACPGFGAWRALAALAICCSSACASLPRPPAYPTAGRSKLVGLPGDLPPEGVLRPGDLLVLTLTHGAETRELIGPVDARGMLHIAYGTDLPVAGLSLKDAEDRVAERLGKQQRFLQIRLRISERPTQRISVLGALKRPGYLELSQGMHVTDLVAAAGGLLTVEEGKGSRLTPIADLADARLVRDGKALPIDIDAALRGVPAHNVYVHPGDQLYVPYAMDDLVSVLGQVTAPGVFVHHEGMRLTEVLAAAGGVTVGADKSDIRLVRGTVEAPQAYSASLAALVDQQAHDVALAAGDVVFVTDDPQEDIGEVFNTLLFPLGAIALSALTVASVVFATTNR